MKAGRQVIDEKTLPTPGKEAICPHCGQLTIFKHLEQFPGDGPFKAFEQPVNPQKAPIVITRKSYCGRENCGRMVVTIESPQWRGTLIPYKQYLTEKNIHESKSRPRWS